MKNRSFLSVVGEWDQREQKRMYIRVEQMICHSSNEMKVETWCAYWASYVCCVLSSSKSIRLRIKFNMLNTCKGNPFVNNVYELLLENKMHQLAFEIPFD